MGTTAVAGDLVDQPKSDSALSGKTGFWTERFEISRGGVNGNLAPMEGLRGLAVVLVFTVHYLVQLQSHLTSVSASGKAFMDALSAVGHSGVDLFFVLSGHLIYGALIKKERPFFLFMARRIRRIYPTFLVVFGIYLMLNFLHLGEDKLPVNAADSGIYILQNLLLLPGLWPIPALVTVAWSLSYEMFFYLLTPLVISLLRMRQWSSNQRLFFLAAVGAVFAVYCALDAGPVRLLMFIAGAMLREMNARLPARLLTTQSALVLLTAAFAVTAFRGDGSVAYTLRTLALFGGYGVLCGACFESPASPLARAMSWTPLRWLGNMSYSYYLIHGLALVVAFSLLSRLLGQWQIPALASVALALPAFFITLLPAAALYLSVERPLSLQSQQS